MKEISRLEAVSRGERPDRVPVVLALGNYAAKVCELPIREFFLNPKTAYEANRWVNKLFPQDGSAGYSIPESVCWDFGGEVEFDGGWMSWPHITRYPAEQESDVWRLSVPSLQKAEATRLMLEYTRLKYADGRTGGVITASSPFRTAIQLVKPRQVLDWMMVKPELVHHLCRLSLDYTLRMVKWYIDAFGVEGWSALVTYPFDSHNLISPEQFLEFSAPYAEQLHAGLWKMGIRTFEEHLCGNHIHNLPFWKERLDLPKHTTISFGKEMPIELLDRYFGEDFVLAGNVDCTLLSFGTPREVYEETRDVLWKMKNRPGGFILMAACVISNAASPANIAAMIQAAEDHGSYD